MTQKQRPDDAAAVQAPLIPLAGPAIPELGAHDYTWGEGEGLIISAEEFGDAIGHDEARVLRKKNAFPPSAWIEGPGAVTLLIEGFKLLKGASRAAGTPMNEIKAVVVKALPSRSMILVAPAKEGAPGSIPARRKGHGPLEFTISEILRAAEMEVTSGYRERFRVEKVSVSPIGPAIGIEVGVALATSKVTSPKKKEEGQ